MQLAGELIEAFREDLVDTKRPYLWTDAECYRYADTAYKQFVRKMGGIGDFLSEATVIALSAGEPIVSLHPSILNIRTATLASNNQPVDIINAQDIGSLANTDYNRIVQLSALNTVGTVRYLIIGMQENYGRVVQVPATDDSINLVIYRLPLNPVENESSEITEIAEHHRPYLMLYMKHLAYLKQDAETFDRARSVENLEAFNQYCAQAKSEWERYKHKVRVVAYGGL